MGAFEIPAEDHKLPRGFPDRPIWWVTDGLECLSELGRKGWCPFSLLSLLFLLFASVVSHDSFLFSFLFCVFLFFCFLFLFFYYFFQKLL